MAKTIVTVGFEIPGHADKYLAIDSDQSLMDYDIIVFLPDMTSLLGYVHEQYQGKSCLDDHASFRLKEKASRWNQELLSAFEHGKTIFIYLLDFHDIFVATGTQDFSGTGRNRVRTRHVESFNNFRFLPLAFDEITSASGREMRPAKDLGVLAPYWSEFGALSQYQVYFSAKAVTPMLLTKTGNKTVGGLVQGKLQSGKGALALLPKLDLENGEYTTEKNGEVYWNKKALEIGHRLIAALVEIDKAITSGKERTPEPDWVKSGEYRLIKEQTLENQITELSGQIESMQATKRQRLQDLKNEGALRYLLYESGGVLEDAILDALCFVETFLFGGASQKA